ncbi:MAG: DNA cytosine methyltransferase [Acidovorax sp.]|uniref:DNA cytosine methyltransferase n=1 Tax=Acidovorax sp. TaxID=1872122 RepID=UPI00391A408B
MKRDAFTLPLAFPGELIIDNFAGGGGTSTGLEAAFGRPVDIAINHDPEALAMHAINHPHTQHLCESVWDVDPIAVTGNQPVGLVWLSPDCKHFSKAKGGTPVKKHIRGLAWVGMRWVAKCKPRVLMLENVEEFKTWGPLLVGADGTARPDPTRKGKTFDSFVHQLRAHGYVVDWRELRACDQGAPTIRKRLFLIARRDGLPIVWPDTTHGEPTSAKVLAGKLLPYRTAAECIDFTLPAASIFDRKKPLATNTQRRVAKGLWRHVLTNASPFIVGGGSTLLQNADSKYQGHEHANHSANPRRPHGWTNGPHGRFDSAPRDESGRVRNGVPSVSNDRTHGSDTGCVHLRSGGLVSETAQRSAAGQVPQPEPQKSGQLTAAAAGTHRALTGAHLVTIGYGERPGQDARTQDTRRPLGTAVAGGVKQGVVAATLVDMGHGEGACGTKRFSHGVRNIESPLNAITASGGTSALVAACLEQANGGFYDGDGRAVDAPASTITSTGAQQRLISAYCVKYYSSGGQWQGLAEPMHTLPTKGRMGLVQATQVQADCIAPEHRDRARQCAELLHTHLPEHFPEPADMVAVWHAGAWWVLVEITLRMLKPKELFKAQGFPEGYVIHEIPDPALLFKDGKQAAHPLQVPRVPLTATAQVRMCGNSVSPPQAEALVRSNFGHEAAWMVAA